MLQVCLIHHSSGISHIILGPLLYATPHYDWLFLLFSFMTSVIILIPYSVSLLVLDLTAVMSHSFRGIKKSLELAYFQGEACGLFSSVKQTFPEPHQAYSLEQYNVFISHNRLGMSSFFTRNTFLLNRAGLLLKNLNLLICKSYQLQSLFTTASIDISSALIL